MSRGMDPNLFPKQIATAVKFIDRAIQMFFEGEELEIVLAVANPGHVLLHDIAREVLQGKNTVSLVAQRVIKDGVRLDDGSPVTKVSDVINVLRRDANGLKHASQKPGVELDSVEATITSACTDAIGLSASTQTQLKFLLWQIAKKATTPSPSKEYADTVFPSLSKMDHSDALVVGLAALDDEHLTEKVLEFARAISGPNNPAWRD